MKHERLAVGALDGINDLRITGCTQCCSHDGLSLAAGEQSRTMDARQDAGLHGDLANGLGVTAIDTRLAGQHAVAHNLLFECAERALHCIFRPLAVCSQVFDQPLAQLGELLGTGLLFGDGIRGSDVVTNDGSGFSQRLVLGWLLPIPRLDTDFLDELVDGGDGDLHLLMTKHDSAQHHIFRQFLRF